MDPADIPHVGEFDDAEFEVLLYEFKADLNAYLAEWAPARRCERSRTSSRSTSSTATARCRTSARTRWRRPRRRGRSPRRRTVKALKTCRTLSRAKGLDAVMTAHRLDAIVAPTGSPPWTIDLVNGDHFLGASSTPAAVSGYPSVTVPAGYVFGLPVGISFIGRAWAEGTLIRLAYCLRAGDQAPPPAQTIGHRGSHRPLTPWRLRRAPPIADRNPGGGSRGRSATRPAAPGPYQSRRRGYTSQGAMACLSGEWSSSRGRSTLRGLRPVQPARATDC